MNDSFNWENTSWIASRYRQVRNCLLGKIKCEDCVFADSDCLDFIFANAKAYLEALENEHKALMKDMVLMVQNADKANVACAFCKHYERRRDAIPCKNCINGSKWRWDARPPRDLNETTLEVIKNKLTDRKEEDQCTDE